MKNNRKPTFGVDVDDVLIDMMTSLCAYHNRVHGTNHKREDITSFFLGKTFNCDEDEMCRRAYKFFHSPEHNDIKPVSGAHEVLQVLSQTYTPILISARPTSVKARTIKLIERFYPGIFSEEHYFLGHHHHEERVHLTKGEVCVAIDAKFMIEDAKHNAYSVAGFGIPVFLIDTPWNQGAIPEKAHRMKEGWSDILQHIK